MKRVIVASNAPSEVYRVYYGAPFAHKTKAFNTMNDVAKFLRSNIFLNDGQGVIVEKVQKMNVDNLVDYKNYYEIKDKKLGRKLFDSGIISWNEYNEAMQNSEEQ